MKHLTPNLFVEDINDSIRFYRKLGFEVIGSFPDQRAYDWVMMSCGNVTLMLQTFSSFEAEARETGLSFQEPFLLHIEMQNLERFFQSVCNDVTILKGIAENACGTPEFTIRDTNGYVIIFGERYVD